MVYTNARHHSMQGEPNTPEPQPRPVSLHHDVVATYVAWMLPLLLKLPHHTLHTIHGHQQRQIHLLLLSGCKILPTSTLCSMWSVCTQYARGVCKGGCKLMHTYHSLHANRLRPRGCSIYTNLYVSWCLSEFTHPIHASLCCVKEHKWQMPNGKASLCRILVGGTRIGRFELSCSPNVVLAGAPVFLLLSPPSLHP